MAKANHYGLILAGGRGTRFWPVSRRTRAKQVLPFLSERSLIQETVDRLKPILPPERIFVITNEPLRDTIIRQLPEVPKRQIIAEPAQRNTAPCIALAAQIVQEIDPKGVLGVFPSDHLIEKPARYRQLLKPAFQAAEQGKIAVLGIQPRWPETGYGYIEFDKGVVRGGKEALPVRRFREKPDLATAKKFVAAKRFYWNAGMFFWKVETVLNEMRKHQPKTATLLASLPSWTSRQFSKVLAEVYPKTDSISIDFAVLEKADNVVGVAADEIGWNDLGSWNAVYELLPRDAQENVLRHDVAAHHSSGCYVDARGKLVALLGVKDLIVVDTPDALLVADRSRAQEVGDIVKALEKQSRNELL